MQYSTYTLCTIYIKIHSIYVFVRKKNKGMVAQITSHKLAFEHGRLRPKIKINILVVRMVEHWQTKLANSLSSKSINTS